jgi:Xaa-Pro aminopeptidase
MSGVSEDFQRFYDVLQVAQQRSLDAVAPGVKPSEVDLAGRNYLNQHNLGEYFIHRTGHGIGVETHEEPYIGSALHEPLKPNQAFSVEPGFYIEGKYGARIEDIVITTDDSMEVLNKTSKHLLVI